MAIPENDDTYLDRLLTSEEAAGLPHILNLDPDVNVRAIDQRYLSDAYKYFSDQNVPQDLMTADITEGSNITPVAGDTGIVNAGVTAPIGGNTLEQQRLIDEGIGVQLAPGQPVVAPGEIPRTQAELDAYNFYGPSREYGDPMDIGYEEGQVDPQLAAAVGGKDTTPVIGPMDLYSGAADEGYPGVPIDTGRGYMDEYMGMAPENVQGYVTPEAQSAWQKVQSGLASVGDFIADYGMAAYNLLEGSPVGAAMSLTGEGIMGAIPEWSEADIAAKQYAQPSTQFDPSGSLGKDEFGINTRSDFSGRTYEDRVEDRIAELEARDATIGNKEGGYHENELNTLKNRQKEMGTPDYETGEHWDIEPGEPSKTTQKEIKDLKDLNVPVSDELADAMDKFNKNLMSQNIDPNAPTVTAGQAEGLLNHYQNLLDTQEGLRNQKKQMNMDTTQEDNAIQDIKSKIKGVKSKTISPASFETDITDQIVDYAEDFELPRGDRELQAKQKAEAERAMQETIREAEQKAVQEKAAIQAEKDRQQRERDAAAAAAARAYQPPPVQWTPAGSGDRHGGGGGYRGDPGGGAAGSPFAQGGRVKYKKGGIVDLL